jgi:DNA-binding CsgD family transcriptional regulator/tetratricopeptide (TPR) repeat protein
MGLAGAPPRASLLGTERLERDRGLLERGQELAALNALWASVMTGGGGRLVFVGGEAGVGKTALVGCFCERLGESVRIVWGACDALFAPRPLGPFLEIAEAVGGELDGLASRAAKAHEIAAQVVHELGGAGPAVIVLEDLHWSDEASLDVLRLLARRVRAAPLFVIATYREDELDRDHPLRLVLGGLATNEAVARVELAPLSPEAVAELAAPYGVDALGLFRATSGNPFFVTETLAAGGDDLPVRVRDAVLARAAGLSPAASELLEAVAVVPHQAELWVVEAIAGGDDRRAEECVASGMLVAEGGALRFRHELARRAIEESLSPNRYAALHRHAMEALASAAKPDVVRLTHHAVAISDGETVLRFAPAAAESAGSLGAHREAAALYAAALVFADTSSVELRAALLEGRSRECLHCDQNEQAIEAAKGALEGYRQLGEQLREGELLLLLASALWCIGSINESTQAAAEGMALLEQLPAGRELAMAYSVRAGVCMDNEDPAGVALWGNRAAELAERLGETEPLVRVLIYTGISELLLGHPAGLSTLERGIEMGRDAGLDGCVGTGYLNLAWAATRTRSHALLDRHLAEGFEFCNDRGLDQTRRYLLAYRARMELDQGRYDDAAESAALVLREPSPSVMLRILPKVVLATLRARRGDPEVEPLIQDASRLSDPTGQLQQMAPVAAVRAEVAWLDGDHHAVAEATEDVLRMAIDHKAGWVAGELAVWRWRAGIESTPPPGAAEPYALQIAGDWAGAAQLWNQLGCPYEEALALADGDDPARRRSLAMLHSLGARRAATVLERRLRERGVRGLPRGPRPRTQANPAGLTARELDVLACLTEGLRNSEIAARLCVSQRTVDHHVSAILGKLDVRSRNQVAAAAARLGLTGQG